MNHISCNYFRSRTLMYFQWLFFLHNIAQHFKINDLMAANKNRFRRYKFCKKFNFHGETFFKVVSLCMSWSITFSSACGIVWRFGLNYYYDYFFFLFFFIFSLFMFLLLLLFSYPPLLLFFLFFCSIESSFSFLFLFFLFLFYFMLISHRVWGAAAD